MTRETRPPRCRCWRCALPAAASARAWRRAGCRLRRRRRCMPAARTLRWRRRRCAASRPRRPRARRLRGHGALLESMLAHVMHLAGAATAAHGHLTIQAESALAMAEVQRARPCFTPLAIRAPSRALRLHIVLQASRRARNTPKRHTTAQAQGARLAAAWLRRAWGPRARRRPRARDGGCAARAARTARCRGPRRGRPAPLRSGAAAGAPAPTRRPGSARPRRARRRAAPAAQTRRTAAARSAPRPALQW